MQIDAGMALRILFSACLFQPLSFSSLLITLVRLLISPIIFTKLFNLFHPIGHLFNDDLCLSRILVHFLSNETEGNHKTPVSNWPVFRSRFKRRSSSISLFTSSALPLQQSTG